MGQRESLKFSFDKNISLESILSWSESQNPVIILNSNSKEQLQKDTYSKSEILIAVDSVETIEFGIDVFQAIREFHKKNKDWLFGYFSYDVKNQVERLKSSNHDRTGAKEFYFFCPKFVIEVFENEIVVHYHPDSATSADVFALVNSIRKQSPVNNYSALKLDISSRVNKDEYIEKVRRIKEHIQRGDIYEMNYCMEFFAENAVIDPIPVYFEMNMLSPMPFSSYSHINDIHIMCASPERFIAKRGDTIISQPIKGTARRSMNEDEDALLAEELRNDPKEQSENVMIVDIVRNDLSRTAAKNSVSVEELFGVKTFRNIHQMISTVTSKMREDIHFTEVIKKAFPMGSMTGAPKIRAMELIEEFENSKRGIYSGAIGYITPSGDFDFNVVIRTIIYNSRIKYLSFHAGSAITIGSDPEKEYEECLLKAENMKKVLNAETTMA